MSQLISFRYANKIQPPYDFSGEFERIYNTAKAGEYDNEYKFGFELYRLFQKAHVRRLILRLVSMASD